MVRSQRGTQGARRKALNGSDDLIDRSDGQARMSASGTKATCRIPRRMSVCFWQKSGRVYNLRVVERTDTRHAVGSNPVSAQFLWKTGTMPKMSRDFWHNSPKNFQIRDAENQCLR